MAAKLEIIGEYVYLWDKLLQPVVLDSLGPLVVMTASIRY